MWFVYILRSLVNDRFYIGSTNDLNRRLKEHARGKTKSTRFTKPFELVYKEMYNTSLEARRRERYIKKKKSRKFIEWLIGNMGL